MVMPPDYYNEPPLDYVKKPTKRQKQILTTMAHYEQFNNMSTELVKLFRLVKQEIGE